MRKSLFVLLCIVLLSCNEKDKTIPKVIIDAKSEDVSASEIIDRVCYVELETTDSSLIGEIKDIKLFNDTLYLLEGTGPISTILVYSVQGKFLYKLGSYGKGPDELNKPRAFYIDSTGIYVWDTHLHHFYPGGNYHKRLFKAFFMGNSFIKRGDDFVFFHGHDKDGLFTIWSNGKLNKKGSFNNAQYTIGPTETDRIYRDGSELCVFSPFIKDIYRINKDDGLEINYIIDFQELANVDDILPKTVQNPYELMQIMNKKNYCRMLNFFPIEQYLVITYFHEGEQGLAIFDKTHRKTSNYKSFCDEKGLNLYPDFLVNDRLLCKVVDSEEFMKYESVSAENTKRSSLKKDFSLMANPILVLYNMK